MARKSVKRAAGVQAPSAELRAQVARLRAIAHADYRIREAGPVMLIVLRDVARYLGFPSKDIAEHAFQFEGDTRTKRRAGLAISVWSAIDAAERGSNYGP